MDVETVENFEDAIELPEELVVKILKNLDAAQLKTHLTIKDHRDLILKHSGMMRKLPLILQNQSWNAKIPFMRKFGDRIKEIKFNDCGFDSLEDAVCILKLCESVEAVAFHNCYIKAPENEPVSTFFIFIGIPAIVC
jgi:hypothetical protein